MFLDPMLAEPIDVLPDGSDFVMEPKYDGWRTIAAVTRTGGSLYTRTGNPITSVPYLVRDLVAAFPAGTVIDGEIVDLATDRQWNRVQALCSRDEVHHPTPASPALTLVVFDILQLAGEDLKHLPLLERKAHLQAAWDAGTVDAFDDFTLQLVVHEPVSADRVDELLASGFEGVVVKDVTSRYLPGARNGGWHKLKPQTGIDAICTGTFAGTGRLAGLAGGLTFRLASGHEGRVGTGFSDEQRREITTHPERYVGCEIELLHHGVGEQGALRNPVFDRVRSEKETRTPARVGGRPTPAARPAPRRARPQTTSSVSSGGGWKRNYAQMGDEKLTTALDQLRAGAGDAHQRCLSRGGDPAEHLERAEAAARDRGLI